MTKGVDCAAHVTPAVAESLKNKGYEFVCRYFGFGWKVIDAAEARVISDAGLRLLCVWENDTDDHEGGGVRGTQYGAEALRQARAIGMPEDAIIYAAIDSLPTDFDLVAEYLSAFGEAIRPYRLGVYGCYYTVEEMARRGIGEAYWQCIGWSNGLISSHMTLYQYSSSHFECGIYVDSDRCDDPDKAGMCRCAPPGAWYDSVMRWAEENGINDGTRGGDAATRAEVAQMIYNYGKRKGAERK